MKYEICTNEQKNKYPIKLEANERFLLYYFIEYLKQDSALMCLLD